MPPLVPLALLTWLPLASAEPCSAVTAGLDTTYYNYSLGPYLGWAVGQTFYAPESVITRITVWRPPGNVRYFGMHLWVVPTRPGSDPAEPITWPASEILLDGPTLYIPDSDPPGRFIEVSFVLDPPLVLPGRGTYAFFLQAPDCFTGTPWLLCADTTDWKGPNNGPHYPYGQTWRTYRPVGGACYLPPTCCGDSDYIFEIEYCDTATPVRRATWGKLKMLYR